MGRSREFISKGGTLHDVDMLGEAALKTDTECAKRLENTRGTLKHGLFRKLILNHFFDMAVKVSASLV